jgi:pyruvate formate lyase activating enzyme
MDPLRVGGLTPFTTIDYPGALAAVIYCQGCPWRCAYCHNGHLIPTQGDGGIPWGSVVEFLQARRELLDAVVFSGGEPTLQPGLGLAMEAVRGLGFKVGLHTAGAYPARLRRILPLVDWVGLDIKSLPEGYAEITGVSGSGTRAWASLELLLDSGAAYEVRTTPLPGRDGPRDLGPLIRRLVRLGAGPHRIQTCRTERVLDPGRLAAT